MTIDAWTPSPSQTILASGATPYAITHPYSTGTIGAEIVQDDGSHLVLESHQFMVSPSASTTTGTLYLKTGVAGAHAGRQLIIARTTPEQQAWAATLGNREAGLEAQLDRVTMRLQELGRALASTLRTRSPLSPFTPQAGAFMVFDEDGNPANGPSNLDVSTALALAAEAPSLTYMSRAAAEAATIPGPVNRLSILHANHLLHFVRAVTLVALTTAGGDTWAPAEAATVLHWGAQGNSVDDDAPAIQAAITACAGRSINIPDTGGYYPVLTTPVSASVAFQPIAGTRVWGDGFIRNFCQCQVFDSADDEHGVIIEGLKIDHGSQAMDDLSIAAVAALDPLEFPYKAHSGYGTEDYSGIFPDIYQYAGWPHMTAQDSTARFCIRLRGSNSVVRNCTIIRSHTAAIRFSRTTKFEDPPGQPVPAEGAPDTRTYTYYPPITNCQAIGNMIIEPRLTGINFSSNTEGCLAVGNTIVNAVQIGIAAFTADLAPSNGHVITGNRIINTRPLGENGIACEGHKGATITGNVVEGYGAVGIRAINSVGGAISGNVVRDIGMQPIQAARYPTDFNGVGIFVHNNSTDWAIAGNSVKNTRRYGIVVTEIENVMGPNIIRGAGHAPVMIDNIEYTGGADFEYSATRQMLGRSRAVNHVSDVQSLTAWSQITSAPAGVLTVTSGSHSIVLAAPTNITSIVDSTGSLGFAQLILRCGGGGAPVTLVHNIALLALKGGVNRLLATGEAGITLMRRAAGQWIEV